MYYCRARRGLPLSLSLSLTQHRYHKSNYVLPYLASFCSTCGEIGAQRGVHKLAGEWGQLSSVWGHGLGQSLERKIAICPTWGFQGLQLVETAWLEQEGIGSSLVGRDSDLLYKSTLCQLAQRAGWRDLRSRVGGGGVRGRGRARDSAYKASGARGQAGKRFYLQN